MHFIIFTGGILEAGQAVDKSLSQFDKIVAVDNGASHCSKLKLTPDFLVGDFDSVDKKLLKQFEKNGNKIIRFLKDKDQTDTELAIDLAVKNKATNITILGGINGSRTDHLLSNILLLLKKKFANVPIKFADGNQEIYIARKSVIIKGKKGETISFIPITGSVNNIVSSGLKYDLANYHLSIQGNHGISNVLTDNTATVSFPKGSLLIIHTLSD